MAAALTPLGNAVNVTWATGTQPSTGGFIVKASPAVITDGLINAIDTINAWEVLANCAGTCAVTVGAAGTTLQNTFTNNGQSGAIVTTGGAVARGSSPFLLRREIVDARADFCASVQVNLQSVPVRCTSACRLR